MSVFTATITVENLSELSQVHMADFEGGSIAWVNSVPFATDGGMYVLLKSASLAANGTTVISAASGSPIAGNAGSVWVFLSEPSVTPEGGFVYLRPIDGVTDDVPTNLLPALLANAYANVVVLLPGLHGEKWQIKTPFQVPSGTNLWGTTGTVLQGTLPAAGLLSSVLTMFALTGTSIALTANNTPGTRVIQLASNPGVGTFLQLQVTPAHLHGSTYEVISVAAAGPNFNVTLDQSVVYTALSASARAVPVTTLPRDIRIQGNGMRIEGAVASSYVLMDGAWNCYVADLILDGSTASGTCAMSGCLIDTFTVECRVENLVIEGLAGTPNQVGAWLIGEFNVMSGVIARNFTTGFVLADAVGCVLEDFEAYGMATGINVTSDGLLDFAPSESTKIQNGFIYGCSANGIEVAQGALAIMFEGVSSRFNGGSGASISNVTSAPRGVFFSNCDFMQNTSQGIQDTTSGRGLYLTNCDVSGNTVTGILCLGQIFAKNITSRTGNPSAIIDVQQASEMFLDGFDLVLDSNATQAIIVRNTAKLHCDQGRIQHTVAGASYILTDTSQLWVTRCRSTVLGGSYGIYAQGTANLVIVEDFDMDGNPAGSLGLVNSPGCTFRVGRRVNVDGCATPFSDAVGAFWSRSLDTLAARFITIPVGLTIDVNFPDLKQADRVELTKVTENGAGVPVPPPLVTKTVNTKFTVVAAAGDAAAVYAYNII